MHTTTFADLHLRIGSHYLFVHQGDCTHRIVFTGVRAHTPARSNGSDNGSGNGSSSGSGSRGGGDDSGDAAGAAAAAAGDAQTGVLKKARDDDVDKTKSNSDDTGDGGGGGEANNGSDVDGVGDAAAVVDDCSDARAYPRQTFRARPRTRRCACCDVYEATHVTYGDAAADTHVYFWCNQCYVAMHYDADGRLLQSDYRVFPA
jgi:hypothetical protein